MRIVRPRNESRSAARLRSLILLPCAAALISACQPGAAAVPTAAPTIVPAPTAPPVELRPVPGGPTLLREGIELRKVASIPPGSIRLLHEPVSGDLLYLTPGNGIYRVPMAQNGSPRQLSPALEVSPGGTATGMAIGPDGVLYVVANQRVEENKNMAVIRRGTPGEGGTYTWKTMVKTEPYPLSDTPFDHMFNGMLVSPDGKWLYVNSGSRTDHGEIEDNKGAFPDTREVALTAKIFRIPTDASELELPNDEAKLAEQGLIFAHGTRNAYDMAFAPNGDLFAIDNGPDADYADELNWIQEGKHYGFPWRFGSEDNPQQRADYNGSTDKRLSPDFTAVKNGTYKNDPSFPKPPGEFTPPVANMGPAAAVSRADDGSEYNAAAQGQALTSFTPHRSPLGLVFPTDTNVPADYRGQGDVIGAFVLSWGAAGGNLSDQGQDLLHLALHKKGENYEMTTNQIARGFSRPIDAVMVENRLYVIENGENASIWELTFS